MLVWCEPPHLGDVVRCRRLTAEHARSPVEVERVVRVLVVAVAIHPDPDEVPGLDLEPGLLEQLAPEPGERMLALVEEAAWEVPVAAEGLAGAAGEEGAALVVGHDRACRHLGAGPRPEAAFRALRTQAVLHLQAGAADRAEIPPTQLGHGVQP